MKTKAALKVGDILFRVDPKRLSVKVFKVAKSNEVYNYATTTYENFSIECEKRRFQLPFDEFPLEFKGFWYFLSEEEANDFVKAQIEL